MWYNIEPGSGIPIFIQLKEQIKDAIVGGVLKENEKMPSVRELSKELVVNPNTVSKAYRELESEGFLRKERGIGMFVTGSEEMGAAYKETLFAERLKKIFFEAYYLGIGLDRVEEMFMEILKANKESC